MSERRVALIVYVKPEGKQLLQAQAKADRVSLSKLIVGLVNDGIRYRRLP